MDETIDELLQFICETRLKKTEIDIDKAMRIRDNVVTISQQKQKLLTDEQCSDMLYCLLAALDETIMTHIHDPSSWLNHSAVYKYYNDTIGGDNFYSLVDKYSDANSSSEKYICKINYFILALGFKGKAIFNDSIKKNTYIKLKNLFSYHPITKKTNTDNLWVNSKNDNYIKLSLILLIIIFCSSYTYLNNRYTHTMLTIQHSIKHLEMSSNHV